jgi:hypothetical protein
MKKDKHLTQVEYEGYTAIQAKNHHIMVYKNGRIVMHSSCNVKKTEDELREHIEFVKGIRDGKT